MWWASCPHTHRCCVLGLWPTHTDDLARSSPLSPHLPPDGSGSSHTQPTRLSLWSPMRVAQWLVSTKTCRAGHRKKWCLRGTSTSGGQEVEAIALSRRRPPKRFHPVAELRQRGTGHRWQRHQRQLNDGASAGQQGDGVSPRRLNLQLLLKLATVQPAKGAPGANLVG